jgi:signal transduction histidine kinase
VVLSFDKRIKLQFNVPVINKMENSHDENHLHFESLESRLVGSTRLILSVWAFFAIYFDPVEVAGAFFVTYWILASYIVYSLIICLFGFFRPKALPFSILHWLDVVWTLLLISFSAGTSSIFYFFFFFSILIASFRYGFSEGLRVTAISAFSFTVVGYMASAGSQSFELNRFILRPGYLMILGYMMAYWGGKEIFSKKRLALLRDLSRISNPRFGISQTISSLLQQLNHFYDAEVSLLVLKGLNSSPYSMIKVTRDKAEMVSLTSVPKEVISPLLMIPPRITLSLNYEHSAWDILIGRKKYYAFDLKRNRTTDRHLQTAEGIANFLEVKSLLSVPIFLKQTMIGRLFIGADRCRFTQSDLEFMLQTSEQIMPAIENVQLLDDLASTSAGRERVKISRDLHDSTVQPYLGLKFKLEGILRKLSPDERLYGELSELVTMVTKSVTDLRGYISNLKEESIKQEPVLFDAIRRQAAQFTKHHSLKVDIDTPRNLQISDRLAAEVFQMVSEGLSNINRHTKSDHALIRILTSNKTLILTIENNNSDVDSPPKTFFPKSLAGRAKALGGDLTIEQNGKTSVVIKIPI